MQQSLVLLLVLALPLCFAAISANTTTCGGNCPGGKCPSCPCGTTASPQNIASVCQQFSGWDQTCCQCIASHESGGNANAANYNSNGSFDVGVWQINQANWASCSGGSAPCAVSANLQCAVDVWKWGGGSFKLWSTCSACGCCSPSTTGSTAHSSNSGNSGNSGTSNSGHSGNSGNSGHSGNSGNSGTSNNGGTTYSAGVVENNVQAGGAGKLPSDADIKAFKL